MINDKRLNETEKLLNYFKMKEFHRREKFLYEKIAFLK